MSISIKLMSESFSKVKSQGLKVAEVFYSTLFSRYPESKSLFHETNLEKQKQLLVNSIDFAVSNLGNEERLAEFLQNLGERHDSYGADEVHFDWVAECLMFALEDVLGEDWNEEVQSNWAATFNVIKDYMIQGMRRVRPATTVAEAPAPATDPVEAPQVEQSPTAEESAPVASDEVKQESAPETSNSKEDNLVDIKSKMVADIAIPENLKEQIRTIVRQKIQAALEEEVQKIMNEEMEKLTEDEITKIVSAFKAA